MSDIHPHPADVPIQRGVALRHVTLPLMLGTLLAASSCGAPAPPAEPAMGPCTVIDGDTIRCGTEKIRLLGIDAPEMPGHCRAGRVCVTGDPFASRSSLSAGLAGRQITLRRFAPDRYGRTLAIVLADGENLSCRQVEKGMAVYKRGWDNGRQVARDCPTIAR